MQDSSIRHMAMSKYHIVRICWTALSGTCMHGISGGMHVICRIALSNT